MPSPYELESGHSPVYPDGSLRADIETVQELQNLIHHQVAPLVGAMTLQRDYDSEDFLSGDSGDDFDPSAIEAIIFNGNSALYNSTLHVTTELSVTGVKHRSASTEFDDTEDDTAYGLDSLCLPEGDGDLLDEMTIAVQMFPGKFHILSFDGETGSIMADVDGYKRLGAMWLQLAAGGQIQLVDVKMGDDRPNDGYSKLRSDVPLPIHFFSDDTETLDSDINVPTLRKIGRWLTGSKELPVAHSFDELASLDVPPVEA